MPQITKDSHLGGSFWLLLLWHCGDINFLQDALLARLALDEPATAEAAFAHNLNPLVGNHAANKGSGNLGEVEASWAQTIWSEQFLDALKLDQNT